MATPKVEHLTNSQIVNIIDEKVHNELHRKILKRRLCDGLTYEKIGEEFFYSAFYMKKIVYSYCHLFEE